jgi:hypothetical protein
MSLCVCLVTRKQTFLTNIKALILKQFSICPEVAECQAPATAAIWWWTFYYYAGLDKNCPMFEEYSTFKPQELNRITKLMN